MAAFMPYPTYEKMDNYGQTQLGLEQQRYREYDILIQQAALRGVEIGLWGGKIGFPTEKPPPKNILESLRIEIKEWCGDVLNN